MSTLNARANQAWLEYAEANDFHPHSIERDTFEEGWETGYKTAAEEVAKAIEDYEKALDDAYDKRMNQDDALRADAAENCATIAREIGGVS